MTSSDQIFELISSMSQTEKRYFKRYATIKAEKSVNYVLLFEAIEKQKSYNEEKLKNKFGTKFFAQQKRHLHLKIMESLRAYYSEQNIEIEIDSLIHDFEILFKKTLLNQSKKALLKAKKLAYQHELFTETIRIYKLETKLLRAENNLQRLKEHAIQYEKSTHDVVGKIINQINFEKEYIQIIKWNNEIEFVRSEKELINLKEIMKNPIFKNEKMALSDYSKSLYYYINGLYNFFLSEFKTSEEYFEKHLLFLEKTKLSDTDDPLTYIKSIANFSLLNLKLNQTQNYHAGLVRFEKLTSLSNHFDIYIEYYKYTLELINLTNNKKFADAVKHIEKHKIQIQNTEAIFKEKNSMYIERTYAAFRTILAYMQTGDNRKALRFLNAYLNDAQEELKQDTFCIAKIIGLFIHFEIGNISLLESNLKSTLRYLKNKGRLYKFEKIIIGFIKNILDIGLESEARKAFNALHKELLALKKEKFEQNVFDFFDFTLLTERKIS